jgi:uncharacterized membrane protein YkoI
MGKLNRLYALIGALAVLMLAVSAVTIAAHVTNAGGSGGRAAEQCIEDDDAVEPKDATDTDEVEEVCGPQDEADEADEDDAEDEEKVAPGTIDDGAELLSHAQMTLDQAIAAAQGAASGALGEVDLEYYEGTLVFNIDIGDDDVKVDAQTGDVLGAAHD